MTKLFTRIYLAALLIASIASIPANGQKLSLYLDSFKNVCTANSTINVPLRTKGFNNVLGIQGSINWDTSYLQYNSISYGTSAIAMNSSNLNLTKAANGYLTILWTDANFNPETVSDTTILFSLNFTVKKITLDGTNVSITNSPLSTSIDTASIAGGLHPAADLYTAFIPGYVGFVSQPTVSERGSTLTALPSGNPSTYQWLFNGSPVTGDTLSTLINAVSGGSYTVVVYYSDGCMDTSATVTPVTLHSFTGYYKNSSVHLSWVSASETNTNYYAVERSTDGKNFTSITTSFANEDRAGATYSYTDFANNETGNLYYRLRIVDKDGAVSYSKIVSVQLPIANYQLAIYPNPVTDILSLQIQNKRNETATIKIIDMAGKVKTEQIAQLSAGTNHISLNISTLAKGSYEVVVVVENQLQQQFIKL